MMTDQQDTATVETEWMCPRCAYPLDKIAEGNTLDLWECAQCGWLKVVEGERK